MEYKIFSYIDQLSDAYSEPVQLLDGLSLDWKDTLRTIEFYSNDKFLSGNTDNLGREKPFYNIGNYRVTTAKVATDIDVKDIKYEPDSLDDSVAAMLINHELYKYLKESNFAETLNDMGFTRPKYGELLVSKFEEGDKLKIEVEAWKNIDVDPCDVANGTKIKTHYLQPSELASKADVWDKDAIREFMKAHARANKNKPVRFEVKELIGELPLSYYPDEKETEENDMTFKRMCFYIGVVNKKKFMLYYEYEKENRFKSLSWEKRVGAPGKGIIEAGFESQVWTNDSMIAIKNIMDLSGKVILSTTSKKVSGNAITGVDNGHIFELEPNATITSLNLAPTALPEFSNLIELWKKQFDTTASTYDANTGEAPTAGTPYSQTALLNQVANSPFEYQREVWGIFLNEILNDWILPFLKKRIKKAHYLVSEFSDDELQVIDEAIHAKNKTRMVIENLTKGAPTTPEQGAAMEGMVNGSLKHFGGKREIEIPAGFLDVDGKITANITGELKNKAAILQSLDGVFKTVVSSFNPTTGQYAALQDPTLSKIFGMIVEMSGVPFSSSQLRQSQQATPQTAPAAQPDLSAVQPQPAQ